MSLKNTNRPPVDGVDVGLGSGVQRTTTKSERLREARLAAGFRSAGAAAERIGISPSTYRAHENGQNDFDDTQARAYARAFHVTPRWLILGEEPEELKRVPLHEVEGPEAIDPDRPMTVGSETGASGIPRGSSPQLDATAGMGAGGVTVIAEGVPGKRGMTFAAEHVSDWWRLPSAILASMGVAPEDIIFLPVRGDSMLPTLADGDVAAVDTRHRWPSPDGVYALIDSFGDIIVKRLELAEKASDGAQMVSVISDNPRHSTKTWRLDELRIVGLVRRKFGSLQ
jgi:phage repressor protein C with HTH and peptisase S24 domain